MGSLFFYISGHGFGHSIRQIEIIKAVLDIAPVDLTVVVRTTAPGWLFARELAGRVQLQHAETDTGVVQIDALRLDERATIDRAALFYEDIDRRIREEAEVLARADARLVIADTPPLPCAAAKAAGIPGILCSNFTWDWIYGAYADASPAAAQVISTLEALYATASEGWRLPMHGGFGTIAPLLDLPLVARRANTARTREDLRAELQLPRNRPLALVSFGGYAVADLPLNDLDCTRTWGIVVPVPSSELQQLPPAVLGLPEDRLPARGLQYADLIRAVDVVVSKPGYGIISDCIGSGAALLYTSRGRFPEYDVLVREMPRFLRSGYLTREDLLAGRWLGALEALAAQPAPPERADTSGAETAARLVLERIAAST